MKNLKWVYWISTGLLTLMMLGSAGMYIAKNAEIQEVFLGLGFPTFIIYPLAIAKILGLIAIWTNKSKSLKEWAYAGFFFDFIIAAGAHLAVGDGEHFGAIAAMVIMFVSYYSWKKVDVGANG